MSAFTLEPLAEAPSALVLRFDAPGEKVNLLRAATMDELEQRLDEVARRHASGGVASLLIESGKPGGFIAGADVRAFATLADAPSAQAAARRGQAVFAKLAKLPIPTVALIHGACMGGGLELALACRHRVATEDAATKLGLPEVQLGIVPGFGGTQRLPRCVGLLASLPLLLTGKRLGARAARKIGLVDRTVVGREQLRAAALQVVASGARSGPRSIGARAIEALLRRVAPLRRRVLARAAAQVRARAGELYPAPFRILDCVEASFDPGGEAGFEIEARHLGELLAGPVSRNLVRLFQLSEAAPGEKDAARALDHAFVAGAGQMGASIASLFAGAGLRTRLHDADLASLARGFARASDLLTRRFREDRRGSRVALDRLEASPGRHGLARCQVALEAVVERLDVKQELLGALEEKLPSDALLATNTSSLDLDALAERLQRPQQLVGIHFFHPAETMRLVEIVRGRATAEDVVGRACALAKRLGKVPVIVANRPGFLVNRLLAPYLLEAERLVQEGASIVDLDRALREAGQPMGPIELLDEVGLDVANHVGGVMRAAFPDRAAMFGEVGVVRRLVESRALGKKSGRGFYRHDLRGGRSARRPAPEFERAPEPAGTAAPSAQSAEWRDRLLLLVVAEAWRCLDERVVADEDSLDLAMMLGAGFLIPQGGPARYARARGLPEVVAALDAMAARHGPRFEPPAALRAAATTAGR